MIIVKYEQGSDSWKKYRQSKIGASESSIVLGISPYCSPYMLWQRKLGLIPEQVEHGGMTRGKSLESDALEHVKTFEGMTYYPAVVESSKHSFMIASLDGLSIDLKKACEIKCLNLEDHNAAIKGTILPIYYAQIQHQCLVCDLQEITYVGYHPDANLAMYAFPVKRDDEFIADYIPKAKAFWDCVQRFDPPALIPRDYRDFTQNAEYAALDAAYIDIDERLKGLEKQKEEIRQLMEKMSEGNNVLGPYTKMTKVVRKGAIRYNDIPELKNLDLEKYRAPSSTYWKISYGKTTKPNEQNFL